jgi:hypothetical protein
MFLTWAMVCLFMHSGWLDGEDPYGRAVTPGYRTFVSCQKSLPPATLTKGCWCALEKIDTEAKAKWKVHRTLERCKKGKK